MKSGQVQEKLDWKEGKNSLGEDAWPVQALFRNLTWHMFCWCYIYRMKTIHDFTLKIESHVKRGSVYAEDRE